MALRADGSGNEIHWVTAREWCYLYWWLLVAVYHSLGVSAWLAQYPNIYYTIRVREPYICQLGA